ncbi:MAG: hypothetical protein ACLP7Q_13700 [Isosphaeraceae bacterium]
MRYAKLLDDILIAVAVVAQAGVVLSARYLPYADTTNHLSRYVLMEQYWFGTPPAYVEVSLRLTNYIGLDLMGVALREKKGTLLNGIRLRTTLRVERT